MKCVLISTLEDYDCHDDDAASGDWCKKAETRRLFELDPSLPRLYVMPISSIQGKVSLVRAYLFDLPFDVGPAGCYSDHFILCILHHGQLCHDNNNSATTTLQAKKCECASPRPGPMPRAAVHGCY